MGLTRPRQVDRARLDACLFMIRMEESTNVIIFET